MKADEPGPRVVKYGMAAMEEDKLVQRHFTVTQEERAVSAFHVAFLLRIAPWVRKVLSGIPKREQSAPGVVEPKAVAPAPPPEDLRKSLGLS